MADLIECPTCKKQISGNAAACPNCGEPIKRNKCRSKKWGFISIALGIVLSFGSCALSKSDGVSVPPGVYLGALLLIAGIVSACICFTSPSK